MKFDLRYLVTRVLTAVVVALVLMLVHGKANAQNSCVKDAPLTGRCQTEAEAVGFAQGLKNDNDYSECWKPLAIRKHGNKYIFISSAPNSCSSSDETSVGGGVSFTESVQCPAGEWPDPTDLTKCLSAENCKAKNADLGNLSGQRVFTSNTTVGCTAGCAMDYLDGSKARKTTVYTAQGVPVPGMVGDGEYGYTGGSCGATAPDNSPTKPAPEVPKNPPKKPEECVQAGTQTMCVKPGGEHCATASTGRRFCWTPGETGTKTDGPDMQRATPGPAPGPPTVALPNGDTATKQGESVTVQQQQGGHTSTTTITNYKTESGANAGSSNQGQVQNADGTWPDKDGKDGKDKGTYSGGQDCSSPPVTSGDPQLGGVVDQAWLTRCAGDKNNDGQPDWTEVKDMEKNPDAAFNDSLGQGKFWKEGNSTVDGSSLNQSGFGGGGGSCPALGAAGGGDFGVAFLDTLANPPPMWCNNIATIRAILILFGVVAGVLIIAGYKGS